MTVIATAENPQFSVSRIDIDRGGPTYTIDTLRDLRALNPDADLFFITGADALGQILTWRDAEELFSLAHFIGVTRPGHTLTDPGCPRAASRSSRFPRWPSRPPTAVRGSPRATRSGTWCRTVWCATSTSASCTAASEPRGAPVNDRYDRRAYDGDQQYETRRLRRRTAARVPAGARSSRSSAVPAAHDAAGQQQGYGYDPYATGSQAPADRTTRVRPAGYGYDPYDDRAAGSPVAARTTRTAAAQQTRPAAGYDPVRAGGDAAGSSPGSPSRPPPSEPAATDRAGRAGRPGTPAAAPRPARGRQPAAPAPRRPGGARRATATTAPSSSPSSRSPTSDSEDVIDWLKFTESRTERREEAKRRGRSRVVALVVVLALVAVGGVGYLWYAGKLPGRRPRRRRRAAAAARRPRSAT